MTINTGPIGPLPVQSADLDLDSRAEAGRLKLDYFYLCAFDHRIINAGN